MHKRFCCPDGKFSKFHIHLIYKQVGRAFAMIVICGVLDGNNGLGVFRSMLSTWRQFGLIRVLGNSLLGALWVALFFLLLRNGELQDELMVLPALDNIWVRFCVGLPLTSPNFDNYFAGLHIDPCPSHGFGQAFGSPCSRPNLVESETTPLANWSPSTLPGGRRRARWMHNLPGRLRAWQGGWSFTFFL